MPGKVDPQKEIAYFISASSPHHESPSHPGKPMTIFEKIYSLLAVAYAVVLIAGIIVFPDLRHFDRLLPASLIGLLVNIGLMFILLRDIFLRRFSTESAKYLWLGMVLILWPSIIYYLLRYGFKPRSGQE